MKEVTNYKSEKARHYKYYNGQESNTIVLGSACSTSRVVSPTVFAACSLFLQMVMAFPIIFLTFDGF